MSKSSIFTSAAIASLLLASGTAVAQADHQIVYSYAALLDSAGNHYVPINEDMYPPMAKAGYLYFMDVNFRFTNRANPATPVVVTANANNPGVSFAGWRVRANGSNVPTAWLIKLELVPSTGAPRILAPATLGDKFYIGYDPALYTFDAITLADPLPTTGGAALTRRASNFADLPDIAGGSWRADYSRAAVVAAASAPTGSTTKISAPATTTTIKPTIPVIKK